MGAFGGTWGDGVAQAIPLVAIGASRASFMMVLMMEEK